MLTNNSNMLRINSIDINGIGPIFKLHLDFNPHFNIICGSNGIGKTTILECLAESFCGNEFTLRKNSLLGSGNWTVKVSADPNNSQYIKKIEIDSIRPDIKNNNAYWELNNYAHDVLFYKINRSMNYVNLDSISKDPNYDNYQYSRQLKFGTDYADIKKWFLNRFLWSKHVGELSEEQLENLNAAKSVFSFMAENFSFERIDHESNDIIINTPKGKIVFEQLSAGYISFAIVLLGLIKDIEYRYKNPHIKVSQFSGILIIDEMDVHLHPELQARIYNALDKLFPSAQIFTSTHSPHVIQVAKPDEVIPLVSEEDGNVHVNPIVNKKYGCQGWTIEEILQDVMGMKDTRSAIYKGFMDKFNWALQNDDMETAHSVYNELKLMLHPDNVLRKVLEIQMIGG